MKEALRDGGTWLTPDALQDVLLGACILGVGGGGPRVLGESLLRSLDGMALPRIVLPEDVPDTAQMAVSACAGSPTAAVVDPFPFAVATAAFTGLAAHLGVQFDHVLPGELGAGNSFIPMLVAAQLGLPLVDASGARRAMTTLPEATFAASGVPISPVVAADGKTKVVFSADSAEQADPVLRAIMSSGTFPDFAGVAMWAQSGDTMKRAAIGGTLAYARELGATLRQARGKDPVEAVRAFLKGKVLFRGKIIAATEQSTGGFDVGRITLQSLDGSAQCTVYNQNENLIAWSSQKPSPLGMGPDLLCWLTAEGEPFTNAAPDIAKFVQGPGKATNKEVVLIGAPSPRPSRAKSIVSAYMSILQQIGYAGPYVPVEDLP